MATGVFVFLTFATRENTINNAVSMSINNSNQFKILRSYYTRNVVEKVTKNTDMAISFNHRELENAIPLPATMIHDLSAIFKKEEGIGTRLRLYSAFPFPNRKARVVDSFGKEAMAFLAENPDQPFVRESTLNGQAVVRVAIADRMVAKSCVDCHNTHPQSPKIDWKIGDVRGVLETISPIEGQLAANRQLILVIALIVAGIGLVAIVGITLSLLAVVKALRLSTEQATVIERMGAITQVVGGFCHNFNNIHQIIAGNLALLTKNLQGRDKEIVSRINRAIERATKLNYQLLYYGNTQQQGSPRQINLKKCLEDFFEQGKAKVPSNIHATLKIEASLWPIFTDWQGLTESLSHLLENAEQAMPEGGTVAIGAANMTLKKGEEKPDLNMENGDYVRLSVSDTGKGMPPDVAEKAFEPFFSTENLATRSGLGLSHVYGFVKQSQGYVRIESRVGQGTNVQIFFPRQTT